MTTHRPTRNPGRPARPGLSGIPAQRGPRSAPHPVVPTRPAPDPSVPLRTVIYAFPIYDFDPKNGLMLSPDPATGKHKIRWDYVGQTIRSREIREGEHLEDKPWADLVAGPSVIVEQGVWNKKDRDAREVGWIKKLRPRFNHDDNLDNPERIPIWDPKRQTWTQIEHRHARDRAAGRPLWLTVEQRLDAERNSVAVQQAHRRRTDRTPGELAWDVACVLGRWVAGWPRRVHLTWFAVTLWAWMVWGSASLLIRYVNFPSPVAWGFAAASAAAALLGPLRSKPVRRWARRGRRRR